VRFVPQARFTLAWMHSIEKIRWEEDYRVQRDGAGRPRLRLALARIQGTGAGMEPPPDAVRRGAWYSTCRPTSRRALRLTRSPYTADFELCPAGQPCRPMGAWLPSDGGILLWACERVGHR
jgi:hypothetical protein